jgi:AraC-like DNA-binding protein
LELKNNVYLCPDTTMNRRVTFIIFLLELLFLVSADAARMNDLTDFYNRWNHLTEKQLVKKGNDYLQKDQADSALLSFSLIANRYYEQSVPEEVAVDYVRALSNLGYMYNDFYYDYQKAYNYLQTAEEVALKYHTNKQLPYVYLNMGVVLMTYDALYQRSTASKETMAYFQKAFFSAAAQKEWRAAIFCFNDMMSIYEQNNDLKSFLPIVRKMKQLRIPARTSLLRYTLLRCDAAEAWIAGHTDRAMNLFRQAQSAVNRQEMNSERLVMMVIYDRAKLLMDEGRRQEALACLQSLEQRALKNKLQNDLVSVYDMLYQFYQGEHETALADRYQLKYLRQKDALTYSGHLGHVSQMQFLNKLRKANEQVQIVTEKRRDLRVTVWIVSSMLVVIIGMLLMLAYSYRKQRHYVHVLYQKNMQFLLNEDDASSVQERYQNSLLTEEDKDKLLHSIKLVLNDIPSICPPSFSLQTLCERVESNSSYVSQVINERYGRTFKVLLNELRVNEACRRLSDPENYGQFTIEAVSSSVGFKSRANFAVVFKKITGLTPTEFQHTAHRESMSEGDEKS